MSRCVDTQDILWDLGFIWLKQRACVGENGSKEEEICLFCDQIHYDVQEGKEFVCQLNSSSLVLSK